MPVKKKATGKGKITGHNQRVTNANNNNNDLIKADDVQMINTTSLTIGPRIFTQAAPTAVIRSDYYHQSQSTFFSLPAEIRLEVYKHVFATNATDEADGCRVIVIQKRRNLRSKRDNEFLVKNFKPSQLSIMRTCKLMRIETKPLFLPKTILRFADGCALSSYVGNTYSHNWPHKQQGPSSTKLRLLYGAHSIQCIAHRPPRPRVIDRVDDWYYLNHTDQMLSRPLGIEFISDPSGRDPCSDEHAVEKNRWLWELLLHEKYLEESGNAPELSRVEKGRRYRKRFTAWRV